MLVKIVLKFQMYSRITNVHSKQPKSTIIITESKKRVYIVYCLFIYFLLFSSMLNNLLLRHIWYDLQPFFILVDTLLSWSYCH